MDLEAGKQVGGRRFALTKSTAFICFLLATVLLIGSLVSAAKARITEQSALNTLPLTMQNS